MLTSIRRERQSQFRQFSVLTVPKTTEFSSFFPHSAQSTIQTKPDRYDLQGGWIIRRLRTKRSDRFRREFRTEASIVSFRGGAYTTAQVGAGLEKNPLILGYCGLIGALLGVQTLTAERGEIARRYRFIASPRDCRRSRISIAQKAQNNPPKDCRSTVGLGCYFSRLRHSSRSGSRWQL